MTSSEIVIWSAMLGALLLLAAVAASDVVRSGSLPAWRGLGFVLLTGTACVVMTGLPEHLLGWDDGQLMLPAKVALGPLSGALALLYLGIWLGRLFEDWGLRIAVFGGAIALLGSAVVMIAWALWASSAWGDYLIAASGVVNLISVVLAMGVALRGAALGDLLARWMVLACVFLAVMVLGLYAHALRWHVGAWLWVLTAVSTAAYFLIVTALTLQRNLALKRLHRLARGHNFTDDITGLPMGSMLLSKVDDALWRSARRGNDSAVIAVWLDNIYDLSDDAGHAIEHEIRARLTAILRQAVGFRNVVGLLQARCFLVVMSSVASREASDTMAQRILTKLNRPMRVGDLTIQTHDFVPQVGIGIVYIPTVDHSAPLPAIDKAQKLAQLAATGPEQIVRQELISEFAGVR
jgi:GGDEF domain-containing protein